MVLLRKILCCDDVWEKDGSRNVKMQIREGLHIGLSHVKMDILVISIKMSK